MKTDLQKRGNLYRLFQSSVFILFFFSLPLLVSSQSVQEEWARRYNASTTGTLQSDFIVVDQFGNLFTAGIRLTEENRKYVQVAKFASEGALRWVNIYHTSAGGFLPDIYIDRIAVDEAGDLFVIGSSQGSDNRYQSLILKFSSGDGILLWEQAFRLGMFSYARDIKFDNQGAVYILSTTDGGPERTLSNITTSKINSVDGSAIWSNTYDGGVNGSDDPKSIALDNQGGVFITGSSTGFGTRTDIVTIKYSAETGKQVWLQRLDINGQTQEALSNTADNAGGVYVTGSHDSSSGAEDSEALIVKYNAEDGVQLWLNVEDGSNSQNLTLPNLPTSNAEGLFVVQAEAGVNNSTKLVKYNSTDGSLVWARTFSGTPNAVLQDSNSDIILVGNGHVTGNILVAKYNKLDGSVIWQQEYEGRITAGLGATLNKNQGTLVVAALTPEAGSNAGVVVLTISIESGEIFIVSPIALGQSNETPVSMAVDADGNTFVAINITSIDLGNSIILLKYSPDGVLLWESKEEANTAVAYDMVIGKQGGIYITGTRRGHTIYTAKFNQSDGLKIWEKSFSYVGLGGNIGYAIASSDAGVVYVTGSVRGRLTDGMAVLKYDAETGEEIWNSVLIQPIDINNTTFLSYIGRVLTLDAAGDIYIAGELRERQSDYLIAKVRGTDGQIAWSKVYGSSNKIFERATAIEAAVGGEVYVTGISNGDFATIKLNPTDGAILWEAKVEYNSPGTGTGANALTLDNIGNVYVTGQKAGTIEAITVKYSAADGNEVWRSTLENTIGYIIKTDDIGGVYIAGANLTLVKYSAEDGNLLWEQRANSGTGKFIDLVVDKQLNVYATGDVQGENIGNTDVLTVKYSQELDQCNIPVEVNLYLPPVARQVGWQVRTTADFGSYILNEDTGVRWTWGDSTPSTVSYTAFGTPRITGEHTYQQAGIYQIGLDFSQSCLNPTNTNYEQWVPIFDPEAGFVTGAGQATALGQRLGFNFSLGYSGKFATEPRGHTHFLIQDLGMFRSRSLEWLVVSVDQAAWRGEGVIDGKGRYGFIASVTDAGNPGPDDAGDRLRIKVWDMERGNRVVYDSFVGGGEILDMDNQGPTIDRGNIIIHGSKRNSIQASVNRTITEEESFAAYPNTFSEHTTISFTLQQEQNYILNVYDTKGRLVRQLASGKAAGTQQHEFSGKGLHEGLYIARLVTSAGSKSIKLLLKR